MYVASAVAPVCAGPALPPGRNLVTPLGLYVQRVCVGARVCNVCDACTDGWQGCCTGKLLLLLPAGAAMAVQSKCCSCGTAAVHSPMHLGVGCGMWPLRLRM